MGRGDRRKCKCCLKLFRPDPRNRRHQYYCSASGCRAASKAASQARWLAKPENQSVQTLPVAVCPAASESACRWPSYRSALAGPRLVFQTFKAMVGITMVPKADYPRLDPDFLGDRPGAAPGRRQQNYPRPLQIALQCHR
jgi:hypothetical protein